MDELDNSLSRSTVDALLKNIDKAFMRQLVKCYLIAKVMHEIITELIQNIKNEILHDHIFSCDADFVRLDIHKGMRITNAADDCFISKEERQRYYALVYEKEKLHGIAPEQGPGYCADAPYRNLKACTEDMLVAYFLETMRTSGMAHLADMIEQRKNHITWRDRILSLILSMDIGKIEYQPPSNFPTQTELSTYRAIVGFYGMEQISYSKAQDLAKLRTILKHDICQNCSDETIKEAVHRDTLIIQYLDNLFWLCSDRLGIAFDPATKRIYQNGKWIQ